MKYQAPYGSSDPDADYVDRNSTTATSGSKIPAGFPNWTQREIVDVIEKAGFTPDDVLQLAAAIQSGGLNYAVAGGTANALTVALSSVPEALPDGMIISVLIATANTGPATINVNGLGADDIVNTNGGALLAGDMPAGNVVQLIRRNGEWRINGNSRGRLLNTQVFKVAGAYTYTPTPGTQYVEVEVQGGGGAGGGTPATGANQLSIAGGGGSGAWAQKLITSGFSGVTVTVGAGGAGVSGGAGGAGGASSFGALVSANGGSGGNVNGPFGNTTNANVPGGAAGAVGASGDINASGMAGVGVLMVSGTGTQAIGAASRFSGGPGAGGAGNSSPANTAAQTGSPGQPGIVIVREYA
ncbi:hypothetical protein J5N58_07010 [Rhizobium cremeum]|uniref:glycine-rich domain-containing protein n=1 Tax=Rhizobium cremeum TaxID=2813827 RepID=UPI001FD4AD8B|nr:hypothetical protein [Rhizobium cremeum]MCJ7996701.1 hypothetical protein [Rhizobium cremeum]MCJ7999425.1 hypothetical protein [Rhizobium cremeum]